LFGIFKLVCASVFFIGVLYIITQFFNYVQHDMKALIASYESDLLGDQMYCQHQYELNRCSPQTRLPAIVDLCREWERCMLKPLAVSRTKILAEVAAEMWNGFTKTLTVKSMVLNLFVGGMILVF
ncbi:Brl1/Brr6 domain-containing protein, partial [Mycotypha africana]|uniref:Brl1/Brr6 domain-containing protein n=1 Tax=Mycotypha africana TaxID=64632 RepID=UPI0023017053